MRVLIPILCFLLCSCSPAAERSTAGPPAAASPIPSPQALRLPRGPFKHPFKVETKYDRFKDQVRVWAEPKTYHAGPFALFLFLEGYRPKNRGAPPATIRLGLTAMSTDEKYTRSRRLILLADGKRFDLGELERSVEVVEGVFYFERLSAEVPFSDVVGMATSRKLEAQLNDLEFEVPPDVMEVMRDFTSRFAEE